MTLGVHLKTFGWRHASEIRDMTNDRLTLIGAGLVLAGDRDAIDAPLVLPGIVTGRSICDIGASRLTGTKRGVGYF